eukprot:Clim_evm44s172 gene=Clim_evmTU44s172
MDGQYNWSNGFKGRLIDIVDGQWASDKLPKQDIVLPPGQEISKDDLDEMLNQQHVSASKVCASLYVSGIKPKPVGPQFTWNEQNLDKFNR